LAERKGFDAGPEPQAWPYLLALPGAAPQPSGLHLQLNWIREGTLVHGLSHSLKGWAFSVAPRRSEERRLLGSEESSRGGHTSEGSRHTAAQLHSWSSVSYSGERGMNTMTLGKI
jgi:hypothetical protein